MIALAAALSAAGLLGTALAVPAAAGCPDDLAAELDRAAASRDSAAVRSAAADCPDRVHVAVIRLADRALAAGGGEASFTAALFLATLHQKVTGSRGLRDAVEAYAAWNDERVATRARADSLRDAGTTHYLHGRFAAAAADLRAADILYEDLGDIHRRCIIAATLAGTLSAAGDLAAAREQAAAGIELGREVGYAAGCASALFARGAIEMGQGDFHGAIETFREIHRVGVALAEDNYAASALAMLANAYSLVGRMNESRAAHEEGIELFRRLGNERALIGELINVATIDATDRSRWSDAATALGEAVERSRENRFSHLEAIALDALADVKHARGETDAALRSSEEAIERLRELEDIENLANALANRGRILREAGRADDARQWIQHALDVSRQGVSVHSLCETLTQASFVETANGEPDAGLAHAREAIDRFDAARGSLGPATLRASFLDLRTHLYEAALEALLRIEVRDRDGRAAREALTLADGCRSRTLWEILVAPDEGEDLPRAILDELSARQLELLGADAAGEDARRIASEIREVRARLDSMETRGGSLKRGRMPVVAAPPEGEVHIEYFWGRESVYGFTVSDDGVHFFRAGPRDDLESLVRVYEATLRDSSRAPLASDVGRHLAARLLEGVSPTGREVRRLVIVPDGPLLRFPFEALPADARYLVERFEVSYLPSFALGALLRERAGGAGGRVMEAASDSPVVVAIGDPDLTGVKSLADRPRLPHSDRELRAIARMLAPGSVRVFKGTDASESAFAEAEVAQAKLLHVAGHAHASAVDATASGLLLAAGDGDGLLTTREIAELDLAAELVFLSGCRTGRGRIVGGEGVLGLSRSFFRAGAPSVMATLWEVEDRAAARFVDRVYRHLLQGASVATALASAKREAIEAGGADAQPEQWAPFVLAGNVESVLPLTERRPWQRAEAWPVGGLAVSGVLAIVVMRRRGVRRRRGPVGSGA